ncbi:N-acetylmuramoyl-L-alanine amidase AmiC precursor [bacterium BMS3Bbin14]|nr:N-acetylmuramoyl-L-alanine amidase AmiC precursor [bacterium BMS3Abin13]GBE52043.1 N-acetylmuramoyl-L-alanine amidase AmiC precursor [bacterium BMS3Bbin14]HDO31188.1 AMIN domain-containing protein [Desulfobacteraceae bacterium]
MNVREPSRIQVIEKLLFSAKVRQPWHAFFVHSMIRNHILQNKRHLVFLLLIVFFSLTCCGLLAAAAGQSEDHSAKNRLEDRYREAKDYNYRLERDQGIGRQRRNWLRGIRNFRRLYLLAPKGALAPNCFFMMARMYYRMYRRFHRPQDLDDSLDYYSDVVSLFPEDNLADDALFASAEIFLRDKKNPRQAARLLARQIRLFPKGDKYALAVSRLRELAGKHGFPLPAARQHLVNVLPVKYWSSDDYARVVIRSSAPVHYSARLLEKHNNHHRRLLIDFAQSYIDPKFTAPVPIRDGLLRRIRTSRFDATTVRVILDIQSISNYKIFSLNDPFRVIVDVHGRKKKVVRPKKMARVVAPKPKPSAEKKAPPVTTTAEPAPEAASVPAQGEKQAAAEIVPASKPAGEKEKKEQQPGISETGTPPLVVLKDQKKRPAGAAAAENPETGESKLPLALQLGLGVHRIVIDPGHGGKDPGAMAFGLKEKNIVLKVARETAARLRKKYHYEVILTRDRDVFLPLEERIAIANTKKADLFVSIHVNAHPSPAVRGIETFYLNLATNTEAMRVAARENATSTHNISDLQDILSDLMQNSKIQESSRLAEYVQNSLVSGLDEDQYKIKNLGVKQAPFYVLIGAEMPAVLTEIAFISNPENAAHLRQGKYLRDIADQIADGVADYVEYQTTAALHL